MIKTIIIEDELNARSALRKMLNILDSRIDIIAETTMVSEAIELINSIEPALVFMDVELEDGTSFDILKRLDKLSFKIIFTTAYNKYAIDAFKFSAVDYLLKPIDPVELKSALNRAVKTIEDEQEHQELLSILKNNLEKENQKIVLKTTEKKYIILLNDIIRLEAEGAYTCFITQTQKIIVSKNLKYYQELLNADFVRCHQSHLVNSKHILGIGNDKLQMSNEELVPISTRKKTDIINILNQL